MKIYAVLTTKNRREYFPQALQSIFKQTRPADFLIVVSDSDCKKEQENESSLIANTENSCFLQNSKTKNYAGSLNTALDFIIQKEFITNSFISDDIYIALLDDDDTWFDGYLEECSKESIGQDFVVCGLQYKNDNETKLLSIPQKLDINDFLKGNPHIQGSNTFVKLTTLLKAGNFDEQLSSTTDRDIFVRIMMLKPSYAIINKYLVEVNAKTSHQRITTDKKIKSQGLKNFYYKYSGLMDNEVKEQFFLRAKNLFSIDSKHFIEYPKELILESNSNLKCNYKSSNYKGDLTVGVIVTEYDLGLRLINQLAALKRDKLNILVITNFQNATDEYDLLIKNSFSKYKIVTLPEIKQDIQSQLKYDAFKKINYPNIITDISVARTLLNDYLFDFVETGYIWILDDDMELKEFILEKGKLIEDKIDIDSEISKYHLRCDAVIGGYSNDAPLPSLAILRRSLLDYTYHQFSKREELTDAILEHDYYYDFSDCSALSRETPFPVIIDDLDHIFSGKAISRPLFTRNQSTVVKARGGNTLIFNKSLLKISNISINLSGVIARRGDYFWVQQAEAKGYEIINADFSLVQNRSLSLFDPQKEFDKLTKDLIGSAFTKAYSLCQLQDKVEITADKFANNFKLYFERRLVKVIESLYRINGLLTILSQYQKTDKYEIAFSFKNILFYIHSLKQYLANSALKVAFKDLKRTLNNNDIFLNIDAIQHTLLSLFNCNSLRILGVGCEGIVFTDEKYVYKYFINIPTNIELLNFCSSCFQNNRYLYDFTIHYHNDYCVIQYKYEPSKSVTHFDNDQLIEFILFCKQKQIVFTNIKRSNFIRVGNAIKFIDYGKDIIPFSTNEYTKMVERIYQMIKYDLDESNFKQLIEETYASPLNNAILASGIDTFWRLLSLKGKEQIHDHYIISIINHLSPNTVLDYGAGKCKIAKQISGKYQTSVFDIDVDVINKHKNQSLKVIEQLDDISDNCFDLVNCNLVLCCIEEHDAENIMKNIVRLLKHNGHLIISICNPLFNYVQQTEIKNNGSCQHYGYSSQFQKQLKNGTIRNEYHRPLEFYIHLLQKFGFSILKMTETDGIDVENLLPSSEHLIFTCQLQVKPKHLYNTSLLIKTNPMEHLTIYEDIKHIVLQLEKSVIFKEKIVVIDDSEDILRARSYCTDNKKKLIENLNKAKKNRFIDKILIPKPTQLELGKTYKNYFSIISSNSHSVNGQAIFATLFGFSYVKTSCVLQTDSDMLYCCRSPLELQKQLISFENENRLSTSFSISKKKNTKSELGHRIEVRSSLINLHILKHLLPLNNRIINEQYELTWHRAIDHKITDRWHTKRLIDEQLFYIHPENRIKNEINFLSTVRQQLDNQFSIEKQYDQINLQGTRSDWSIKSNHAVIIFIRGYNTPPTKLKRLFDSLLSQTNQDFQLIYIDDASKNESRDYAWYRLKHGHEFINSPIVIFNDKNVGGLANLDFAMKHVATNSDAIVICIDNDDYLIHTKAIDIILEQFNKGADVTIGNCFRKDKPLKKYRVESFIKGYERYGDNLWLHPKCFKRYLYLEINPNDLMIDNKYINVNEDFAIMLPIIGMSKKPVFIDEILYYFEPSENNLRSIGEYEQKNKQKIKDILLERAKNNDEKSNLNHR